MLTDVEEYELLEEKDSLFQENSKLEESFLKACKHIAYMEYCVDCTLNDEKCYCPIVSDCVIEIVKHFKEANHDRK